MRSAKNNNNIKNYCITDKDWCEFYKNKITRLEEKFSTLWDLLNKYNNCNIEKFNLSNQLQCALNELSKSQTTVSDLQIFLFREREENLRLVAENDKLKISNYEHIRDVKILMKVAAVSSDTFAELFLEQPEKLLVSSSNIALSFESSRTPYGNFKTREVLLLEIESLRTQLRNLETLFHDEVNVLLKDREIVADERSSEVVRFNKLIASVTQSWNKAQVDAGNAVKHLLDEVEKYERELETWRFERDTLMKQTHLVASSSQSTSTLRNTAGCIKTLHEQLEHHIKLCNTYKRQCKHVQTELNKWRERALKTDDVHKTKIQQLTADLILTRKRYEDLNKRRLLEGEGFRTDIKLLKDRINDVNKTVSKVKCHAMSSHDSSEDQVKKYTHNALETAKIFEREVIELKKKFHRLTSHTTKSD